MLPQRGRPVATALELRAATEGRPVATTLELRAVMEGVSCGNGTGAVCCHRRASCGDDTGAACCHRRASCGDRHWSCVPSWAQGRPKVMTVPTSGVWTSDCPHWKGVQCGDGTRRRCVLSWKASPADGQQLDLREWGRVVTKASYGDASPKFYIANAADALLC